MQLFFLILSPRNILSFILIISSLHLSAKTVETGAFVGAEKCISCHQQQYQDWQGSHHDQSMQHAGSKSVLGDFNQAKFNYGGITSTFYKKGDEFWVNTDGVDGQLKDFKIEYTFGVMPLQQYLVGFDDGRYQALSLAWDSRTELDGGQRWFHLYPEENVDHKDVLHWTRYANNWNSRCAECHSTNLQKNYQSSSNSYNTTWSEINVACESCHGPAEKHVTWAQNPQASQLDKGLRRNLSEEVDWQRLPGYSTAVLMAKNSKLKHKPLKNEQINRCAACHSRRGTIDQAASHQGTSAELLDTHLLSLIEPPLYFADGQILEEDYVYGSFVQSKMHQRGVVCSNCHNPHSLELKAQGNQLCAQCHNPTEFDSPNHHHHPTINATSQSRGAQCVNCHMPETTYMVVDPRRDHSLRIPRPDLSKKMGVPNACNQCHLDQSIDWAVQHFQQWYPERSGEPHYGSLMHAGNHGLAQALPQLAAMSDDGSQPVIMRASALQMLRSYNNDYAINVAISRLESPEPLIRLGALRVLELMSLQQRMMHLWPLLDDPVLAIRLETTRLMAGVGLTGVQRVKLDPAREALLAASIREYIRSAQGHADTPSGQLQLGVLYLAQRQYDLAERAYRHASLIEPSFIPALMNLADLYRVLGQDQQALPLLEKALAIDSSNVNTHYAIGLLYIRLDQLDKAVRYLQTAASKAPYLPQYSYVFAVALYENGQLDLAITTLKQALERHPGNRNILSALASYLTVIGRDREAQQYKTQLTSHPN
jgi:predicted CXXCH cytochrome family protein